MKAYTSKAVAAWLDISERRVRQLRDEKVITEIRPGLYDLKTVNHQYINYLRKNNPESESAIDYNAERAKLVRAKREAQELELQLRRNEVLSAAQMVGNEDIIDGLEKEAQELVNERIIHEMNRILNGYGG